MAKQSPLVMLSAGEASGDQHAATLFRELKKLVPDVQGIGMGSKAMKEAGIELCYDSSGIGVIGLMEIARHYFEIRRALTIMKEVAKERRPDLLICVDYKEFNFRLAKAAKAQGIKVLFYVSPQVWAWRPGRVESYGKIIDHMAVIFPFELPFYEAFNVPATYVGHPLAGKVKPVLTKAEALNQFNLPIKTHHQNPPVPIIGLLPGSRSNEIRRILPVILAAAAKLQQHFEGAHFLLFQANSVSDEALAEGLSGVRLAHLHIIKGQDYDALQCADAVITVSGTATLEIALMGIPMSIVYKLAPFSYWLGRRLVNVPFIGLPNILAGKGVVREFIQDDATADAIALETQHIIENHEYAEAIRLELLKVRDLIGDRNASLELARIAADILKPL